MNLFERFEVLEDPRDLRGKKYKLMDIMIMTIYGILCGLTDFVNIADFLRLKEDYFTKLLKLENGTPSHDCLSDLYASIDSKKFMEIFIEWTKEILKTKNGKNISIDAIGTQEEIVNKIVEKHGHYVLKVKDNQKELRKQVKSQFDSYNNLYGNPEIMHKKTIEKDHGRLEERDYFLTYNISTLKDKAKWKTVNAFAYERVQRTVGEETTITDNYYIIDYKINLNNMITSMRDHWNIECGLHWKLDMILDEDHSRNRINNSINNLSLIRKIAFNLTSLDKRFGKVPLQRKLTRYMLDFTNIEKLIFEVIPSIS